VRESEAWADAGEFGDLDLEEPEEEFSGEDGGEVVLGAPELEADEGDGVDAVEREAEGGAFERACGEVVPEVAADVGLEVREHGGSVEAGPERLVGGDGGRPVGDRGGELGGEECQVFGDEVGGPEEEREGVEQALAGIAEGERGAEPFGAEGAETDERVFEEGGFRALGGLVRKVGERRGERGGQTPGFEP
jgi:hypothetical protein